MPCSQALSSRDWTRESLIPGGPITLFLVTVGVVERVASSPVESVLNSGYIGSADGSELEDRRRLLHFATFERLEGFKSGQLVVDALSTLGFVGSDRTLVKDVILREDGEGQLVSQVMDLLVGGNEKKGWGGGRVGTGLK